MYSTVVICMCVCHLFCNAVAITALENVFIFCLVDVMMMLTPEHLSHVSVNVSWPTQTDYVLCVVCELMSVIMS